MRPIPFLICALAAGCGDGGGAGPSDVIPDRTGTYSGTVVFTIATPETHCFAKGLGRLRGHGFRYRIVLRQSGTALSGTLENTDMGISCDLTGSADRAGGVSFAQNGCSDPVASFSWSSEAQEPCELEVTQTGHSFNGSGGLRGTMSLDWDTKDRDTDADLGSIRVSVRVDLTKSG